MEEPTNLIVENVKNLIGLSLSPDPTERNRGESGLKKLEESDFPILIGSLVRLVSDQNNAIQIKQLSLILLKNSITPKSKETEVHRWFRLPPEMRGFIKTLCLQLLTVSVSEVSRTAATLFAITVKLEIRNVDFDPKQLNQLLVMSQSRDCSTAAAAFLQLGYVLEEIGDTSAALFCSDVFLRGIAVLGIQYPVEDLVSLYKVLRLKLEGAKAAYIALPNCESVLASHFEDTVLTLAKASFFWWFSVLRPLILLLEPEPLFADFLLVLVGKRRNFKECYDLLGFECFEEPFDKFFSAEKNKPTLYKLLELSKQVLKVFAELLYELTDSFADFFEQKEKLVFVLMVAVEGLVYSEPVAADVWTSCLHNILFFSKSRAKKKKGFAKNEPNTSQIVDQTILLFVQTALHALLARPEEELSECCGDFMDAEHTYSPSLALYRFFGKSSAFLTAQVFAPVVNFLNEQFKSAKPKSFLTATLVLAATFNMKQVSWLLSYLKTKLPFFFDLACSGQSTSQNHFSRFAAIFLLRSLARKLPNVVGQFGIVADCFALAKTLLESGKEEYLCAGALLLSELSFQIKKKRIVFLFPETEYKELFALLIRLSETRSGKTLELVFNAIVALNNSKLSSSSQLMVQLAQYLFRKISESFATNTQDVNMTRLRLSALQSILLKDEEHVLFEFVPVFVQLVQQLVQQNNSLLMEEALVSIGTLAFYLHNTPEKLTCLATAFLDALNFAVRHFVELQTCKAAVAALGTLAHAMGDAFGPFVFPALRSLLHTIASADADFTLKPLCFECLTDVILAVGDRSVACLSLLLPPLFAAAAAHKSIALPPESKKELLVAVVDCFAALLKTVGSVVAVECGRVLEVYLCYEELCGTELLALARLFYVLVDDNTLEVDAIEKTYKLIIKCFKKLKDFDILRKEEEKAIETTLRKCQYFLPKLRDN